MLLVRRPRFNRSHAADRGIPQGLGHVRTVPVERQDKPSLFCVPSPSPHGKSQFRTDRFEAICYFPQGIDGNRRVLYYLEGIGRRQRLAAPIRGHDEIGVLVLLAEEGLEQGHGLGSGTKVADPLRLVGVVDDVYRTQKCVLRDRLAHLGFPFTLHGDPSIPYG